MKTYKSHRKKIETVNCKRDRIGGAGKTYVRERNKEKGKRKNKEYDMLLIQPIIWDERRIRVIQKEWWRNWMDGKKLFRIRIRIPKADPDLGQNDPQKWGKFKFWSARCFLLRDEDFSCCLDVLYGGLGSSKLQFVKKKISKFLLIKTLDMDPDPPRQKNSGYMRIRHTGRKKKMKEIPV